MTQIFSPVARENDVLDMDPTLHIRKATERQLLKSCFESRHSGANTHHYTLAMARAALQSPVSQKGAQMDAMWSSPGEDRLFLSRKTRSY